MTYRPGMKHLLVHPRTPPVTAHAKDEEWNDRAGMSGPVNGLDASWTAVGNTQSRAYANGRLVLTGVNRAAQAATLCGLVKTQPSTPYSVTCEIAEDRRTTFNIALLGFSDGTKYWMLSLEQSAVVNTDEYRRLLLYVRHYTNTNTTGTSLIGYFVLPSRSLWMRVTNSGTNLIALWSPTGVEGTYETVVSESYATAGLTPTQFGIGVDPFSAGNDGVVEFGPVRVT